MTPGNGQPTSEPLVATASVSDRRKRFTEAVLYAGAGVAALRIAAVWFVGLLIASRQPDLSDPWVLLLFGILALMLACSVLTLSGLTRPRLRRLTRWLEAPILLVLGWILTDEIRAVTHFYTRRHDYPMELAFAVWGALIAAGLMWLSILAILLSLAGDSCVPAATKPGEGTASGC